MESKSMNRIICPFSSLGQQRALQNGFIDAQTISCSHNSEMNVNPSLQIIKVVDVLAWTMLQQQVQKILIWLQLLIELEIKTKAMLAVKNDQEVAAALLEDEKLIRLQQIKTQLH